jgi:hypothetical protein
MDVERRSLLKGLAAGVAGSVVASQRAAADPQAAFSPDTRQGSPAAGLPSAPGLLDDHLRRTLASLAEAILPGSVAAGTVEVIDRVAAVDPPAARRRLLNAIGRFDQEARDTAGARWLDLSDMARASTGAPGQPLAPAWTKGQPVVVPPAVAPSRTTLRDDLEFLKVTIGNAFATTEAGMKALGWAGRSSWPELPGCTHADPAHE